MSITQNTDQLTKVAAAIAKDITTTIFVNGAETGNAVYTAYRYDAGVDNIGGNYWIGNETVTADEGEIIIPLPHRNYWTAGDVMAMIEAKEAGHEVMTGDYGSSYLPIQEILDEYSDYDSSVLSDADTYRMDEDEIIAAAPEDAEAHIDDQSAHYWCTELWAANFLNDFDNEVKIIKIR